MKISSNTKKIISGNINVTCLKSTPRLQICAIQNPGEKFQQKTSS